MKLRITITSFIVVLVVDFASQDRLLCYGLGSNIINVLNSLIQDSKLLRQTCGISPRSFLRLQSTPAITRTFKGNRKKVRVIESSKKIAESKEKNSFYCTVNILITFNCRNVK